MASSSETLEADETAVVSEIESEEENNDALVEEEVVVEEVGTEETELESVLEELEEEVSAPATSSEQSVVPEEEVSTSTTTNQSDVGTTTESSNREDTDSEASWDDSDVEVPEDADDEVTICEVRGTDCHLLEFSGFSIGDALADESIETIQLRMSLGAEADPSSFIDDKILVRYFYDGEWYLAGEITVDNDLSNQTNGGHYLFALPEVKSWADVDDLRVQLEFVRNSTSRTKVFVDGIWIDATYEVERADSDVVEEIIEANDDRVVTELARQEDSAHPDILQTQDGRIEFDFTDSTRDENLIIKSDRETYHGLTKATVYFNVTNESGRQDDIHIQAHLPDHIGEVTSLKKWTKNVPREITIPEYAETAYFCEAGWDLLEDGELPTARGEQSGLLEQNDNIDRTEERRQADVLNPEAMGEEFVRELREREAREDQTEPDESTEETEVIETETIDEPAPGVVEEATTTTAVEENSETESSASESEENETDSDEVGDEEEIVDLSGTETEEISVSDVLFEITGSTSDEVEDASDTPLEIEILPSSTEAILETEEEESIEESVATSSEAATTTVATDEQASSTEEVDEGRPIDQLDFTDEDLDLDEVLDSLLEEARAERATTSATTTADYYCGATLETRTCDGLNADGTNCVVSGERVGERTDIVYRDTWVKTPLEEGEAEVDFTRFQRVAQFFGGGLERKPVPEIFEVKGSSGDAHRIEAGQTIYFEMEIEYPAGTLGEFWVEAIGKKGSYGLLDPWWDANWQYRLPIEIDNQNNSNELTDYQFYIELDNTQTDFWTNVQSAGGDVRFLYQVDAAFDNWYNDSWAHRIPITIQSSQVDDDLTDFPVYVNLADLGSHLFTNASTTGEDIRITSSDGQNEVAREIVSYDSVAETGELYFRASSLSSTTDSVFYLYYGNDAASIYSQTDTYGDHAVWDSNFILVSHMNELTSTSIENSASNSFDGTKAAADRPASSTGQFGEAQDFTFDGSTDYDTSHGDLGITTQYTAEFWFNPDTTTGSGDTATFGYTLGASAVSGQGYPLWLTQEGGEMNFWAYENTASGGQRTTSGANITAGTWHYAAATAIEGGESTVQVDGVERLNFTNDDERAWTNIFTIGDLRPDRFINFDGLIDEVRISDTVRAPEWTSTTYNNMATSTDFYATSTEETQTAEISDELDYWMQYFDSTASSAAFWVQVGTVPANATTSIFMYLR